MREEVSGQPRSLEINASDSSTVPAKPDFIPNDGEVLHVIFSRTNPGQQCPIGGHSINPLAGSFFGKPNLTTDDGKTTNIYPHTKSGQFHVVKCPPFNPSACSSVGNPNLVTHQRKVPNLLMGAEVAGQSCSVKIKASNPGADPTKPNLITDDS